jgi:hypothetical protein
MSYFLVEDIGGRGSSLSCLANSLSRSQEKLGNRFRVRERAGVRVKDKDAFTLAATKRPKKRARWALFLL